MPRTTKSEAPIAVDLDIIQARCVALGPYTVGFESFPQDIDPAPLFAALPDGRCQCPHWGTVVSGQTVRAGDVYYGAPGHLPLVFTGTEINEFSPTEQFQETADAIEAAMAAVEA
jgi:hypothetical protein